LATGRSSSPWVRNQLLLARKAGVRRGNPLRSTAIVLTEDASEEGIGVRLPRSVVVDLRGGWRDEALESFIEALRAGGPS